MQWSNLVFTIIINVDFYWFSTFYTEQSKFPTGLGPLPTPSYFLNEYCTIKQKEINDWVIVYELFHKFYENPERRSWIKKYITLFTENQVTKCIWNSL